MLCKSTACSAVLLVAMLIVAVTAPGCGDARASKPVVSETQSVSTAVEEPPAARSLSEISTAPVEIDATIDKYTGDVTLSWNSLLRGDYNLDGLVDGKDVFALAANFGRETSEDKGLLCVDGNSDGLLNGLDLFTIAAGFDTVIQGYDIFYSDNPEGPFEYGPLNYRQIPYVGCNLGLDWEVPEQYTGPYMTVLSTDGQEYGPLVDSVVIPEPPSLIALNTASLLRSIQVTINESEQTYDACNAYISDEAEGSFSLLRTASSAPKPNTWTNYGVPAGVDRYMRFTRVVDGVESRYSNLFEFVLPFWRHFEVGAFSEDTAYDVTYDRLGKPLVFFRQSDHVIRLSFPGSNGYMQIRPVAVAHHSEWISAGSLGDTVHAFWGDGEEGLKHARATDDYWTWTIEDLPGCQGQGLRSDFRTGGEYEIGLTHWDDHGRPQCSLFDGVEWSTLYVNDSRDLEGPVDIHLGRSGAVLSSYTLDDDSVMATIFDGGERVVTQVADDGIAGGLTAIIEHPVSGLPCVAYIKRDSGEFNVCTWENGGWQSEVIDVLDVNAGRDAYAAIINNDELVFAASDVFLVRFATKNSYGNWSLTNELFGSCADYVPKVAVNALGYPVIGYLDSFQDTLMLYAFGDF